MSDRLHVDFDRLACIIPAVREVAETVRTYGQDRDGDHGIATRIPHVLHMMAAQLESELRWWLTQNMSNALQTRESSALENGELRVGVRQIEIVHPPLLSYVAYPEPDLATRAQRLSSAAEDLRIQTVALSEALVTPSSRTLCEDLRDVAERIGQHAGTLSETNGA